MRQRINARLLQAGLGILLVVVIALAVLNGLGAGAPTGASASPEVYTVEPGDTVSVIAEEYGTSVDTIVSLNNLPSPDEIYPGQRLQLAAESSATSGGGASAERTHVVTEGETLWDIASEYGVDLDALVQRNGLADSDLIRVGQTVIVPSPKTRGSGAARGAADDNPGGRIWMPYRTQLDGSPTAGSNCGPATLGMLMSYFGEWWTTAGIRRSVNEFQGTWNLDAGSTWEALAAAARKRGFQIIKATDPDGNYHRWTIDELVEQTRAGHPVMLLVRYWSLPGHGDSGWWGDHYIAFLGLTPSGEVVYHDSAFPDEASGAYRLMSKDQLIRAWTRTATGLQYTAMALNWPGQ